MENVDTTDWVSFAMGPKHNVTAADDGNLHAHSNKKLFPQKSV